MKYVRHALLGSGENQSKKARVYLLVVECGNDRLSAFPGSKKHLDNHYGVRLHDSAAEHLATNGRHGTLDIGSCGSRGEVLRHNSIGPGKTSDRKALAFGSRRRLFDILFLQGIGKTGGALLCPLLCPSGPLCRLGGSLRTDA